MMKDMATPRDYEIESTIFKTAWGILRKYYNIEKHEDVEWNNIIKELDELYDIGKGTKCEKFGAEMTSLLTYHIEKISYDKYIASKSV